MHLDEKIEETGAALLSVSRRAGEEQKAYCVHELGVRAGGYLPLTWGCGYHYHRRADPQTGGSTPLLAAAEFHCTIINPHTWGHVTTHCNSVCLCSVWLRCRGVQGSKYGFGCDRRPKFAEPRTATARTLADSSFHGMMDKALKLLLCLARSQC